MKLIKYLKILFANYFQKQTVYRYQTFESNSSSSHSIFIAVKSNLPYSSIKPDGKGNIVLEGGEFGWDVDDFYDPLTKANYCAMDAAGDYNKLNMLKGVIKQHTGAKRVIINLGEDAYIDHQSAGESFDAFQNPKTLKEFIFNTRSFLHTDNDNH